jgi:ribosome-associated translation inhibitor RaiA
MRWLDFSPALHFHVKRRIEFALGRFGSQIRAINVLIADENGPRHGPDDKRCEIDVLLQRGGSLSVSATAADPYHCVERAVRRAGAIVRGHIGRTRDRRDVREPSGIA